MTFGPLCEWEDEDAEGNITAKRYHEPDLLGQGGSEWTETIPKPKETTVRSSFPVVSLDREMIFTVPYNTLTGAAPMGPQIIGECYICHKAVSSWCTFPSDDSWYMINLNANAAYYSTSNMVPVHHRCRPAPKISY